MQENAGATPRLDVPSRRVMAVDDAKRHHLHIKEGTEQACGFWLDVFPIA